MRTRAGRSNPLSICDDTGDPISKERLEAVPEAIYTIEAQKRREELNLPPKPYCVWATYGARTASSPSS